VLVQQNLDGSNFFNRSWAEFKVGFGDPSGNYWLGNDELSQLTLTAWYKLRFDLQARSNGNWYYAEYSKFIVLPESYNYTMLVSGYSGNAGNSFGYRYNNDMFSTYDRDNDPWSYGNSAALRGGGFWHFADYYSATVMVAINSNSFSWNRLPGGRYLRTSRMWLHCK